MNVYEEVQVFYESYCGEKRVIGKSVEGRDLFAMHIGAKSGVQGIAQYAIHGREWITSLIALAHIRRGLSRGGIWVLPLTNPDGAILSESGLRPLWKANARGVDLNVNFDARWGSGVSNVRQKSSENYIGERPFSEPETQALRDFTLEINPAFTVSFHTKGEEIYYEFHQPLVRKLRDRRLAQALSSSTGYPLVTIKNSAGGYKDWCIQELKIPAFTVEVGSDELTHPIGRSTFPALLTDVLDALVALTSAVKDQ